MTKAISKQDFAKLCRDMLAGMGMAKAKRFAAPELDHAYRVEIVRESSDKMFRTDESWFCVFLPPNQAMDPARAQAILNGAIAAHVGHLFLVLYGSTPPDAGNRLRESLRSEDITLAFLSDSLAEALAQDFGNWEEEGQIFSFARLREYSRAKFAESPWHGHFQTVGLQPARILPLQKEQDVALAEADLVRALQGGSLLLLGEPGAGKTTSLLALARDLASAGPLTPVFVPLGRYDGDFWTTLGEALAPGLPKVSKTIARNLVESGALVLLLDGINEVQHPELKAKLASEINELTAPEEPALHSNWIVSGRVHDYQQTHHQLVHLEPRRWEMQPFTSDLIYQLLADALDRSKALALYQDMGESVRELCANPLLLNMVLAVHGQHGKAPVGRGALYRQFLDLLLGWGSDRQLFAPKRSELQRLWPEPLTDQSHRTLVEAGLIALASHAHTTQIPWHEACDYISKVTITSLEARRAAETLLDEMICRGVLRCDVANRISFLHHTFQEYFQALQLLGRPTEELIPTAGVAAQNREAILFVAGLLEDPVPLITQALKVDLLLAFEIVRDCSKPVPRELIQELARQLWRRVANSGPFYGFNRTWALRFKRLALLEARPLEEMAWEAIGSMDRVKFAGELARFYSELGDAKARKAALDGGLEGSYLPDALVFSAASAAMASGDNQGALKLWDRCIAKEIGNWSAYANRAICYEVLKKNDLALADYEKAIGMGASSYTRTNYADFLFKMDRKREALEQIQLAIKLDPESGYAYAKLATMLQIDRPEEALPCREKAVRFSPHEDDLRIQLAALADIQAQLGRHADAIRSLRQMISLEPTSSEVKTWKERIAKHRQALDAEEKKRTVRERLLEHGELPLPTLVIEWLKAAGGQVQQATSGFVLAKEFPGMAGVLPVSLLPEPRISGAGLRAALENARAAAHQAKRILVVAVSEALELEARHQWAAMQDELSLGLVSSMEIRDALLQSDLECRRLLDRVMARSGTQDDPFEYIGIVREPTEFFGRQLEIDDFTGRISRSQQVGLYGIHKIGKSSFTEQLRRSLHVNRPEISIIQIELDGQGNGPGDFYRRVLEKLPLLRDLPPAASISSEAFRRSLREFHLARAKERSSHRILLIVDEYAFLLPDSAGNGGLPGFLEVLGTLKTMNQEGWFLLLPCGRSAALNRQGSWKQGENPFIGLLHPCFLGPLSRLESDALITTLGRRSQLRFKQEGLDEIFVQAAGHPLLSRSLGSQILRLGKGDVDQARVQAAVEVFLKDRDRTAIPRAIYESRMDADEQRLARTLALQGPQPRPALFPKDADDTRRRQIRDALQNLIDTSVLIELPDRRIAHRYGILRRVIEIESKELGFE
jgi:tetratricopeptide (TPR) repeat protein